MAFTPIRLNHVALFAADADRAARFHRATFGMDVVRRDRKQDIALLRLPRSGNHHDLALFSADDTTGRSRRRATGLYHLAWQVDTLEDLAEARRVLQACGAFTGESSHGASRSVYGTDPDNNELEIMWPVPPQHCGGLRAQRHHAAPRARRLSPPVSVPQR